MNNNLFNNKSKFVTGQSMPQTNTSNTMMGDILKMNSTYSDIANSIKDISAKYNKDMTAFSDKYESLMNDLLAKKNKYTGNIFKDFLTDYKDARESGVGSGIREGILGLFGGNKQPNISPDSFAPEYQFANQSPEQIDYSGNPSKLFDISNYNNWKNER